MNNIDMLLPHGMKVLDNGRIRIPKIEPLHSSKARVAISIYTCPRCGSAADYVENCHQTLRIIDGGLECGARIVDITPSVAPWWKRLTGCVLGLWPELARRFC